MFSRFSPAEEAEGSPGDEPEGGEIYEPPFHIITKQFRQLDCTERESPQTSGHRDTFTLAYLGVP